MGRLLHALLTDGGMDWAADRTIVSTATNNWPAIIFPRFDQVEFVSTLGAVLGLPEITGFRVYYQTLAYAVRGDARPTLAESGSDISAAAHYLSLSRTIAQFFHSAPLWN